MKAFVNRYHITASARLVDANPNMTDMPEGSTHWRVTLRMMGRQMTTSFSMGPAHSHEPTAVEVLDCLVSDAAGYESARDFADWCAEYGYDEDSRKAERTFKAIGEATKRLRRFLGATYEEALTAERL